MERSCVILGAGIAGLSAGINTQGLIYEANDIAGGICTSYYAGLDKRKSSACLDEESYRFERGGGHWIFGADKCILKFINSLCAVKSYKRKSAVYFSDLDIYVPYPLQNHLFYLPEEIRQKALNEILDSENKTVSVLADWLQVNFGKTLCELFFFPFHELYTAGLYTVIKPQDKFKTPVNKELILRGAEGEDSNGGYNAAFVYPKNGLDVLVRRMAERCRINYSKKVVKIDAKKRQIMFKDGSSIGYENIISTLPLNRIIEMTGMAFNGEKLPYVSVLVVNIGAKKGKKCPDYHWLYTPKSRSGFHRVGFYSNIDSSFLPMSSRKDNKRVAIYVEKAYEGGKRPSEKQREELSHEIIRELREWEFVDEVEVIDQTWVDVAYTWQYPESDLEETAIEMLAQKRIYQTGRYGKWKFQGISESIRDGMK